MAEESPKSMKDAKEQARKEVNEERFNKAKHRYKNKLKELDGAKKVVANLERELEDLDAEISES